MPAGAQKQKLSVQDPKTAIFNSAPPRMYQGEGKQADVRSATQTEAADSTPLQDRPLTSSSASEPERHGIMPTAATRGHDIVEPGQSSAEAQMRQDGTSKEADVPAAHGHVDLDNSSRRVGVAMIFGGDDNVRRECTRLAPQSPLRAR